MKISIILVLLLSSFAAISQRQIVDSIAVKNVTHLSIDRQGNLYFGDKNGNVQKYSNNLEKLEVYSPERKGTISVLDCWNPLKIFVSYDDLQEFLFLDRFMVNANRFDLREITPYAGISAPSFDNNLWFIDYTNFSLKKYDMTYNEIIISRPFDLLLNPKEYSLTHLREYQNLVFLSDAKSGILVFDNVGNYLYKIEGAGIEDFNFLNDEIYYLSKGSVIRRNLYDGKVVKEKVNESVERVLITEKNYFFLKKNWFYRLIH